MRWQTGRRSSNVEDRRGMRPGVIGGGIGAVVLAIVAMLFGVNPGDIGTSDPAAEGPSETYQASPEEQRQADFVSVVLASTEDTWQRLFQNMGGTYQDPTLVLFSGATQSACGFAQSAMGPFYCPSDGRVYLDLSFFQDMQTQLGASGDFARAYVVAHEVGHHVQNLLGISDQVHQLEQQAGQTEANELSVRLELQADCLAGVWARNADQAQDILEQGDIEEALNAAAAVGDDRLQKASQGYVVPESFTHGTSAQRAHWFREGMNSGDVEACNTFEASSF
ncbi:MAG TPA: neutral zinc metallopeptidase [Rhodothermales bacterium]|nr:neutral zinc metallopeptidase [Rhodothermales bacterium]